MKDTLVKLIPLFLVLYAGFSSFTQFEESEEKKENLLRMLDGANSKLARAKVELKKIDDFKKKVGNSKERVAAVQSQIKKLQKQLPTNVNDTEVQSSVVNIANDLMIKEPAPAPGLEKLNGFYFAKDYNLKAKGTFLQFLILMEQIEQMERILNIKGVQLQWDEAKQRGRFPVLEGRVTLESFRFNPNYEPVSKREENVQTK